jgi:hypothetical protein
MFYTNDEPEPACIRNFINAVKEKDAELYYREVSKPLVVSALREAGLDTCVNSLYAALLKTDTTEAMKHLMSLATWFNELEAEVNKEKELADKISSKPRAQTGHC